jgi:hypothetical protein
MSERAWAIAYLKQARADFSMFLQLKDDEDVNLCHALHFLQMATEKLSKAALLFGGGFRLKDVSSTHLVFVEMLIKFKKHSGLANRLGFAGKGRGDTAALEKHIQSLLPLAHWIEQLVPTSESTPNCEYPWLVPTNLPPDERVVAPCDHLFVDWQPTELKLIRLLSLIRQILDNAEDIFG